MVTHDDDIAKVSLVGAGMKSSPGIAAKMFRVLADEGVNIQMISTSTIRVSIIIPAGDIGAGRSCAAHRVRSRLRQRLHRTTSRTQVTGTLFQSSSRGSTVGR